LRDGADAGTATNHLREIAEAEAELAVIGLRVGLTPARYASRSSALAVFSASLAVSLVCAIAISILRCRFDIIDHRLILRWFHRKPAVAI
jgi:hypothetical protein